MPCLTKPDPAAPSRTTASHTLDWGRALTRKPHHALSDPAPPDRTVPRLASPHQTRAYHAAPRLGMADGALTSSAPEGPHLAVPLLNPISKKIEHREREGWAHVRPPLGCVVSPARGSCSCVGFLASPSAAPNVAAFLLAGLGVGLVQFADK